MVMESDILCDEGKEYRRKLDEVGVQSYHGALRRHDPRFRVAKWLVGRTGGSFAI